MKREALRPLTKAELERGYVCRGSGTCGNQPKVMTAGGPMCGVHSKKTGKNPKPASQITDRAKRYRATRNSPPGRKLCNFCASKKNIDVDHITGDESDGEPQNLMYLCRSCNALKGVTQARNRIGVRTMQFNPAPKTSFREFQHAAAVLLGIRRGSAADATAQLRATPPAKRAEYAERIERNPGPPDFRAYVQGVVEHQRGAHDKGGKIIHATPPALRSEYARQIASIKRARRGEVPF